MSLFRVHLALVFIGSRSDHILESRPTFTFSFPHFSSNQLHLIVERTYLFLSVTWVSSPSAVLRRSDSAGYMGIAARAQGKPRYLCL
jgi:hypothetical protein